MHPAIGFLLVAAAASGCGRMEQSSRARAGDGAVIYQSTILTMDPRQPTAEAVIIKDDSVLDLGSIDDLVQAYPGASFDERFLRRTLMPAFVDVRLPPNSLSVLEIPCDGNILPDDLASAGAGEAPVRVVASGGVALAAAIAAIRRIPPSVATGRISVEVRGTISAEAARGLTALGVALVLSDEPPPDECRRQQGAGGAALEASAPVISGRIAIAPRIGWDDFLSAAGGLLGGGSVRITPQEALEAITADAAYALGDEAARGVIASGRRADFAVLDRNPLATPAEAWGAISVGGFSAAQAGE